MTDTINPFLNRGKQREKDKGYAGRKAEQKLAIRVGGTTRPGSGALDGAKGDVVLNTSHEFLIENKTSLAGSFSINKQVLLKIYQEALELNKVPALSFQFVDSIGNSEKRERWVCLPESFFKEVFGG